MAAPALRVLALEPWYGGSHRAFVDNWATRSRHRVEVLGLAPRAWRWRLEAAAWEFAERVAREGRAPADVILAGDYVDIARLRGHLPAPWRAVPVVLYVHETQLAYPAGPEDQHAGDLGPAFANVVSCLTAERVVFNSRFHLESFARDADRFLARLPRPNPRSRLAEALERAEVVAPGVDLEGIPLGPGAPREAPLRVLFPHRFEHDKAPVAFLRAAREALRRGAHLELDLAGERPASLSPEISELLEDLAPVIVRNEFSRERAAYVARLQHADVVASTARHEFFGLAVAEALAAGCRPALPRRLAYPELVEGTPLERELVEDDRALVERLLSLAAAPEAARSAAARRTSREAVRRFDIARTARRLDAIVEGAVEPREDGGAARPLTTGG